MRIFDAAVLGAAVIFFWFPSAFPMDFAASGIEASEWRVPLGMMLLAGTVHTFNWIQSLSRSPVYRLGAITGASVVGALVIWWMLPEPGAPLPVDRADWLWLPFLLIPSMLLRWWHTRHLWPHTIMDAWFLAFALLVVINVMFAPYDSRGLKMAGRPLLGIAIVIHLMSVTYDTGSLRATLRWALGLTLIIGVMGLTMTQWNEKSAAFAGMIDLIPRVERLLVPNSLNPNEIGGALAWVVPLSGGLIAYPWGREGRLWRLLCIIGFVLSLTALIWGQSRLAKAGVILALAGLAWFLLQPPWRRFALAGVGLLIVLEALGLFNLIGSTAHPDQEPITPGLSERDTNTSSQRLQIWDAALQIISTYPITGAGMDRFRFNEVALDFPVVGFDVPDPARPDDSLRPRPPHAHNELLQLGTDLGVPGLMLFLAIYGRVMVMAGSVWRSGRPELKVLVAAALAGLLAHVIYGIGDAIPLWDRFAFVFWVLVGIVAAGYIEYLSNLKKA